LFGHRGAGCYAFAAGSARTLRECRRVTRVVVANPGGQSHLKEVAAVLADRDALDTYVSTVGFGPRDIERVSKVLPRKLSDRVTTELKRRSVSDAVGARTKRVATAMEIGNVLLTRTRLPMRIKFAGLKPTRLRFDELASRVLTPGTDAVLGYQGATTITFRRARELGIKTVLDYPIAHYDVTERLLQEEARLVPEYAPTLRIQRYPDWIRERYVEEIATADRIIMVSGHHRKTFEDAGVDPARTFILPWYVDCDLFSPGEQPPDDKTFRVAFLGQITQRKGISYLVEGFKRAKLDDAELVLIGQPFGDRPWPWEGTPGLRHVPPMPRFKLPETLRTCHAIVLPSLVEGFPISVLEGMACGLPAIVSENIGHDFVNDGANGFVVPIRDPAAIAARLADLHADSTGRREMSLAARATAEQFTRENYENALWSGIEELLSDERPAPPTRQFA
jgi:glycosyltransferase involved in cell wall biosynthesis